jgi:hypothetical protein
MDDIFDTILKLYGAPGIDMSYLPKLIRNKATGEVRRGYGEPDSSLEEVCWELNGADLVVFDRSPRSDQPATHLAGTPRVSHAARSNPKL